MTEEYGWKVQQQLKESHNRRKAMDGAIWMDHKNLEYLMVKRNLNQRQAHWATELADYMFNLHYKKGTSMKQVDILSRRPDLGEGVENDTKGIQLLPQFENHEIQS